MDTGLRKIMCGTGWPMARLNRTQVIMRWIAVCAILACMTTLSARPFRFARPLTEITTDARVQQALARLTADAAATTDEQVRITEIPVRLIYNDPNRHFGGLLDDAQLRLQHYLSVLAAEQQRIIEQTQEQLSCSCGCE